MALVRIAGAAMVLATSHPTKAMLIAEKAMQNVGLSPLLFEVSLVLLRWYVMPEIQSRKRRGANHPVYSGQAGEYGPGNSKFSKKMRFTLHAFRFPIFIAIVLATVGGCIDIHPLRETGSVVLVVTYAFVCGLVAWLAINSHSTLPIVGYRGVLLTLLALPFLLVRIVYFLLLEYGPSKFSPTSGNVGILVGMSLTMEILAVIVLLAARSVIEPIWSAENDFRPI